MDSEERRVQVEALFKVELSRHVDQMTTVKVGPQIQRIVLGGREEIRTGSGCTLHRSDLERFADGSREDVPDSIKRVERGIGARLMAVLEAPQNVLFTQGAFVSLAEARSLLTPTQS